MKTLRNTLVAIVAAFSLAGPLIAVPIATADSELQSHEVSTGLKCVIFRGKNNQKDVKDFNNTFEVKYPEKVRPSQQIDVTVRPGSFKEDGYTYGYSHMKYDLLLTQISPSSGASSTPKIVKKDLDGSPENITVFSADLFNTKKDTPEVTAVTVNNKTYVRLSGKSQTIEGGSTILSRRGIGIERGRTGRLQGIQVSMTAPKEPGSIIQVKPRGTAGETPSAGTSNPENFLSYSGHWSLTPSLWLQPKNDNIFCNTKVDTFSTTYVVDETTASFTAPESGFSVDYDATETSVPVKVVGSDGTTPVTEGQVAFWLDKEDAEGDPDATADVVQDSEGQGIATFQPTLSPNEDTQPTTHTVIARYIGVEHKYEASDDITTTINVAAAPTQKGTTVEIAPSKLTVDSGKDFHLAAKVSTKDGTATVGEVTFFEVSGTENPLTETQLGDPITVSDEGTAQLSHHFDNLGTDPVTHRVIAKYSGGVTSDKLTAFSSFEIHPDDAASITVNPKEREEATVTIVEPPATVTAGETIHVKVQVSDPTPPAETTVHVLVDGERMVTGKTDEEGYATVDVTLNEPGTAKVTAVAEAFNATNGTGYGKSRTANSTEITVNPGDDAPIFTPSNALSINKIPADGVEATLTVTVPNVDDGTVVTFKNDDTELGQIQVTNGTAELTTSFKAGRYSITAFYGDESTAVSSDPLIFTVSAQTKEENPVSVKTPSITVGQGTKDGDSLNDQGKKPGNSKPGKIQTIIMVVMAILGLVLGAAGGAAFMLLGPGMR